MSLGHFRKNKYETKLKKCTFMIKASKFFSYIVSKRGIETNPEKIKAILDIGSTKVR